MPAFPPRCEPWKAAFQIMECPKRSRHFHGIRRRRFDGRIQPLYNRAWINAVSVKDIISNGQDGMMKKLKGELVTGTFAYDNGRRVAVYVPPGPPEAVVYAGDGQLIAQWGGQLEAADVPPTMIVAAYRTGEQDEMARIHEYSPPFNPERFAAHEKFFVEDVRRWVRSRFGVALSPARTAVCGVSASGGVLARHGATSSRHLRRGFLRVAGRGIQTAGRDAAPAAPHISCRRHAGAVLSRERDPVGVRSARCGRGRRDGGTCRKSRRPVLGKRVPVHGRVGVWTWEKRG